MSKILFSDILTHDSLSRIVMLLRILQCIEGNDEGGRCKLELRISNRITLKHHSRHLFYFFEKENHITVTFVLKLPKPEYKSSNCIMQIPFRKS